MYVYRISPEKINKSYYRANYYGTKFHAADRDKISEEFEIQSEISLHFVIVFFFINSISIKSSRKMLRVSLFNVIFLKSVMDYN